MLLPKLPTTRKNKVKLPYLKISDPKKRKQYKLYYPIIRKPTNA